jgi:rubrerythrin
MSDQKSIILLFEENELKISQLYGLYSQALPENKDFWEKISEEEIGHANAIADAFSVLRKKDEYFKENNFTRGIIKYISDFVEEQIMAAAKKKPPHLEAINIALRVEQSMLEKKCFEIFIPTNAELKDVLNRLNKDTERHVNLLRKELKDCQKK